MRCLWLCLLVAPNLCLARIVQIEEMVKRDKGCPMGTIIHETAGHWITPGGGWSSQRYRLRAVYRYRYEGFVQEGKREYIKLQVRNLFLEDALRVRGAAQHNSKTGAIRPDLMTRSTAIEILIPIVEGKAMFPFLTRVLTSSSLHSVEVQDAAMAVIKGRLLVSTVERKSLESSELTWTPPRDWPSRTMTIYLDEGIQDPMDESAKKTE